MNLEKFDVSVIIPTFNRIGDLPIALDSAFVQPGVSVECIVVDDASTDNTIRMLRERYPTHSLRVIPKAVRSGPQASRNLGMAVAQGEFITFLDSDDYFEPNTLAQRVAHCRLDNLDALFSGYRVRFIGNHWDLVKNVDLTRRTYPSSYGEALTNFKIAPMITILYRRSAYVGLKLDESLASGHDDDLSLYLIRASRFAFDEVPAATIVQHVGERVATPRNLMIGDAQLLAKYGSDILQYHGNAYLAKRQESAVAGLMSVGAFERIKLLATIAIGQRKFWLICLRGALKVPTIFANRLRRRVMMSVVRWVL